jgi:hypothetical protein
MPAAPVPASRGLFLITDFIKNKAAGQGAAGATQAVGPIVEAERVSGLRLNRAYCSAQPLTFPHDAEYL